MQTLASLLETLFAPSNRWLSAIPVDAGRWFVLALLLIPLGIVLRQKEAWIFRGAPDRARWRDLRLWACVILLPYVLLYALAS